MGLAYDCLFVGRVLHTVSCVLRTLVLDDIEIVSHTSLDNPDC
jgi:hypothetical protein